MYAALTHPIQQYISPDFRWKFYLFKLIKLIDFCCLKSWNIAPIYITISIVAIFHLWQILVFLLILDLSMSHIMLTLWSIIKWRSAVNVASQVVAIYLKPIESVSFERSTFGYHSVQWLRSTKIINIFSNQLSILVVNINEWINGSTIGRFHRFMYS